jgi:hypothetical protein
MLLAPDRCTGGGSGVLMLWRQMAARPGGNWGNNVSMPGVRRVVFGRFCLEPR